MYLKNKYFFFTSLFIIFFSAVSPCDIPCAPKTFSNESVVCVCNSSYCDTITRHIPKPGYVNTYTSSEGGLRFKKTTLRLDPCDTDKTESSGTIQLVLDPSVTHQCVQGFGGAVTDSAAMNWKSLDAKAQQHLIDSYFSTSGIEYNMIRVPIGGTDFSTRPYTYDDTCFNDTKLTNFKLQPEDIDYKIPMIKACMKASKSAIDVLGSCWSAPLWMKTAHNITGITRLLPEFYQPFANYYLMFMQKYKEAGVPIWAVTTGNEPVNGVLAGIKINDMGWTISEMGTWVRDYLSPTLRNHTKVKILGVDDQRYTLPIWITLVEYICPGYMKALDGVALHFYLDQIVPVSIVAETMKDYPDLFVINTEACAGAMGGDPVVLGSWRRAESYIKDIIEDLNNNFVGWMDWNMCLNMQGGPSWPKNFVDSPIIVNAENNEFYKQPMFYALGHFSKFIPKSSVKISVAEPSKCPEAPASIYNVAFKTPRNTVVIVLYNGDNAKKSLTLKLGAKQVSLCVEPKTIITVEMLNN